MDGVPYLAEGHFVICFARYMVLFTAQVVNVCCCAEVRSTERNKLVYRCQVLGSKGCGKSCFVRGLLGKGLQVPADLDEGEAVTIRAITVPNSTSPVYLVVCQCQSTELSDSGPYSCRKMHFLMRTWWMLLQWWPMCWTNVMWCACSLTGLTLTLSLWPPL